MSEIKILHLFSRLLSLYGEYGNIAILEKTLTDKGHSVTVERLEKINKFIKLYCEVNGVDFETGELLCDKVNLTEKDIECAIKRLNLPVVKSKCPADENTRREDVKNLIKELNKQYEDVPQKIIGAIKITAECNLRNFDWIDSMKYCDAI